MMLLAGAFVTNSCSNGPTAGPCVHTYEDAVLHVRNVTNSSTNAPIPRIAITKVSIDGRTVTDVRALVEGIPVQGIQIAGDSLICTTECAFGPRDGTYAFTAGAAGYQDKDVTLVASFARFVAGCPSSSGGGSIFEFGLQPVP